MSIDVMLLESVTDEIVDAVMCLMPIVSPQTDVSNQKEVEDGLKNAICSGTDILFAKVDGVYVGMASVLYQQAIMEAFAKLEDVAVLKEFRGRGIGEALVSQAVAQAREKNAMFVEITSAPSRIEATQLYQKLGFTIFAEAGKTNYYRKYFFGSFS